MRWSMELWCMSKRCGWDNDSRPCLSSLKRKVRITSQRCLSPLRLKARALKNAARWGSRLATACLVIRDPALGKLVLHSQPWALSRLGIIKKTIALNSLFEFRVYPSTWYVHAWLHQCELLYCVLLAWSVYGVVVRLEWWLTKSGLLLLYPYCIRLP